MEQLVKNKLERELQFYNVYFVNSLIRLDSQMTLG